MGNAFINRALEQMARTIFPVVSELETDTNWRLALFGPTQANSGGEEGQHSCLLSYFGGDRPYGDEAAAQLEQYAGIEHAADDLVAKIDEAAASLKIEVPSSFTKDAFKLELAAIGYVIRTYGLGQPGRCDHIDGKVFPSDNPHSLDDAAVALEMMAQARDGSETLLSDPFRLALALLDVQDFVGHFALEPTEQGINRPAAERAATLDWNGYPYSAIIVPGFGPLDGSRSLSPRGRLQVQLAAQHYQQGMAPFVLLSGGRVWPARTLCRESEEMRKALIERFDVQENAIIVEPYARHTPANLRNATRRLAAVGVPLDKEALVVTNDDQLDHMMSEAFAMRCAGELGHQPGKFTQRLSEVAAAFLPSPDALARNPLDPLDP